MREFVARSSMPGVPMIHSPRVSKTILLIIGSPGQYRSICGLGLLPRVKDALDATLKGLNPL